MRRRRSRFDGLSGSAFPNALALSLSKGSATRRRVDVGTDDAATWTAPLHRGEIDVLRLGETSRER